jgi:uncharacterized MAPEG superfamily protein
MIRVSANCFCDDHAKAAGRKKNLTPRRWRENLTPRRQGAKISEKREDEVAIRFSAVPVDGSLGEFPRAAASNHY